MRLFLSQQVGSITRSLLHKFVLFTDTHSFFSLLAAAGKCNHACRSTLYSFVSYLRIKHRISLMSIITELPLLSNTHSLFLFFVLCFAQVQQVGDTQSMATTRLVMTLLLYTHVCGCAWLSLARTAQAR
jgi:hypothetical protein